MNVHQIPEVILASASPRRRQLLELAEIRCKVIIPGTDEDFPSSLKPSQAAEHVAQAKAKAILASTVYETEGNGGVILAADTMVVLGDRILGKPADRAEAIGMLMQLSGKSHQVITGVCLMRSDKTSTFHEKTTVHFKPLSLSVIAQYVDKHTPYDKAGAYAIQEWIGLIGIASIDGDYYNVMGLPVSRIITELEVFFRKDFL
jgi:septum formation protein